MAVGRSSSGSISPITDLDFWGRSEGVQATAPENSSPTTRPKVSGSFIQAFLNQHVCDYESTLEREIPDRRWRLQITGIDLPFRYMRVHIDWVNQCKPSLDVAEGPINLDALTEDVGFPPDR